MMHAMQMLAAAKNGGHLPSLMVTAALLMALRPHLDEVRPNEIVDFTLRGGANSEEDGVLVRALVPDVDALKALLKAVNSRALSYLYPERDDGIEIVGCRNGVGPKDVGLPLIRIRARGGQAHLEMEIL